MVREVLEEAGEWVADGTSARLLCSSGSELCLSRSHRLQPNLRDRVQDFMTGTGPVGSRPLLSGQHELESGKDRQCRCAGVDVELASIRYHSSQPWPFPRSLMVGFKAKADPNE